MDAVIRCKLRVERVQRDINDKGETTQETVALRAVYDSNPESENGKWSKWTPSATFSISISNPAAMGKLANGHEFYVDFTPAPVAVPA